MSIAILAQTGLFWKNLRHNQPAKTTNPYFNFLYTLVERAHLEFSLATFTSERIILTLSLIAPYDAAQTTACLPCCPTASRQQAAAQDSAQGHNKPSSGEKVSGCRPTALQVTRRPELVALESPTPTELAESDQPPCAGWSTPSGRRS